MMTTETPRTGPAPRGWGALVVAAAAAVVAGLAVTTLGGLTAGREAALGALAGTGFVVVVFALGSFAVHVVAHALPAASLLFALVTYTFQVVLMALVFVVLSRSGLLDETLDRSWLGGAIMAGAACWLLAQVVGATRARIPAYDLPPAPAERAAPQAHPQRAEAGPS